MPTLFERMFGVKSTNGNGNHAEVKTLPVAPIRFPPELFWLPGSPNPDGDLRELSFDGRAAYRLSALAYICIRYRAMKVREAPLMVVQETTDGEEWLPKHSVAGLLAKPNPDYAMARLVELTEIYLCTTGRALWVKNRDRGSRVGSIYPFSGDEFTVESKNGRLYGEFRIGAKTIAPEDVCYFAYADPSDPLGGMAPLAAAMADLDMGGQITQRATFYLRNAMMPGAIYIADKEWRATDDEFVRLRGQLGTMFQGVNSGKTAIAEGGGKIEKGWSLAELGTEKLWQKVEATVCAAFGVPASLIGTVIGMENSPWSHLETAKRSFYDETILPEWEFIEGVLTDSLLRESDDDMTHLIRFDKSRIRALQKDLSQQAAVAASAAKWLSVNERRVLMGYKAVEDPKADKIPELQTPEPAKLPGASNQDRDQIAADARKARKPRLERKDARFKLWQKFDVKARRQESAYEREALEQFEREAKDISRRLGNASDSTVQAALEKIRTAYTRKDGQYHLEWLRRYESLITQTFKVSGEDLAAEAGFDFNLSNPKVRIAILNRTNKLAAEVTDTTYAKVQEAVAKARAEGLGISKLAEVIREDVFNSEITKARATTIARTETVGAMNEGEMIAAEESSVVRSKEWLSQGDGRVRDEHQIDGERVHLWETYSKALQ